jgi:hypothetical protein
MATTNLKVPQVAGRLTTSDMNMCVCMLCSGGRARRRTLKGCIGVCRDAVRTESAAPTNANTLFPLGVGKFHMLRIGEPIGLLFTPTLTPSFPDYVSPRPLLWANRASNRLVFWISEIVLSQRSGVPIVHQGMAQTTFHKASDALPHMCIKSRSESLSWNIYPSSRF